MRKLSRIFIAAILAAAMFGTTAFATEIDDLRNKKEAAEDELNDLEAQLSDLIADISRLEDDLIVKGEEIAQAEEDLRAAEKQEEDQRDAMALRIRYMYESGRPSLLAAVLSAENVADALNKAEYANSISTYDRDMVEQYVDTKNQVQDLKAKLEEEQQEMEELQAQYQAQQEELNTLIADKQQEVEDFDEQLQRAIAEEEARRRAAEEAARAAAEAAARAAAVQDVYTSGGTSYEAAAAAAAYVPSGGGSKGDTIVAAAYSQLGVPYVWGGTSPGVGLDCSGLTQYCYACAGISIPRTSGAQLAGGTIVSDPMPGDICWTPGHVAIYIGGGQMIEAQQSGVPVKVSSVRVTYYVRY